MTLPAFAPVQFTPTTPDELARQGNALSGRVAGSLRPVLANPRLDSVTQSVSLVTLTNNVINHKLDRQPQGWAVLDDTGGGGYRRVAWDAKTITIYSPSTCTVSLEVW
ncbi:MAG: hypothetical protein V4529_16685 [Gemmatimonadota bacterium]